MANDYTILHEDVFDFPVIKTHLDSYPDIQQGLDEIFASDTVTRWPMSITSCMTPNGLSDLLAIPNIESLIAIIKLAILDNAKYLGKPNAKTVIFNQGWANKFFKGSRNNCHLHNSMADGCAIFYQAVPQPNSSKLVLVKNGKDETPLSDYLISDCFPIKVDTGDLVIHHKSIPHGISLHGNIEPRVCIVFNFTLR